jgi:hypothetical protein
MSSAQQAPHDAMIRVTDVALIELAQDLVCAETMMPWCVKYAAEYPEAVGVYWERSRDPVSMASVLAMVDQPALRAAMSSLRRVIVTGIGPHCTDYVLFGKTWHDAPNFTQAVTGGGWFHDILWDLDCAIIGLGFWQLDGPLRATHLKDLASNVANMTAAWEGNFPGPQHECVTEALCVEMRRAMPVLTMARVLEAKGWNR